MKLPSDYYSLRFIDMPVETKALIVQSPDGWINIYVNARLSHAEQRKGLKHELEHWLRDDFDNTLDIRAIERDESAKPRPADILSTMKRAADLVPAPVAPKSEKAVVPLTPYQKRILLDVMNKFDSFLFQDRYEYGY